MPEQRTREEQTAYMRDYRRRRAMNGGMPLTRKDGVKRLTEVAIRDAVTLAVMEAEQWISTKAYGSAADTVIDQLRRRGMEIAVTGRTDAD